MTNVLHLAPACDVRPARPVVVLHDLFGLTDHTEEVCQRLAAAGHETLAPDLFGALRPPGEPAALTEDDHGRQLGFELLSRMDLASLADQLGAARARLGQGPVALVGLSVGGYLGFRLARTLKVARSVLLYPGWLDTAENPLHDGVRALDHPGDDLPPTLVITGERDRLVGPTTRDAIARWAAASGSDHQLLTIPGAEHGFLATHRAAHDREGAETAWARMLDWIA